MLRIRGTIQVFKPHDPSALTSLTTDLQVAQVPSAFEEAQRSETHTSPTRLKPVSQAEEDGQAPFVGRTLPLQLIQFPDRGSKVLQFLAGSTVLQSVPFHH